MAQTRPRRWGGPQRYLIAVDAMFAVAATLLVASAAMPEATLDFDGPLWLSWLVGVAVGGPVAVRRRVPLTAFAVCCAGLCLAVTLAMAWGPSAIAFMFAPAMLLYTVGRQVPTRGSVIALSGYLVAGVASTGWPAFLGYRELIETAILAGLIVLVNGAAWAIGRAGRARDTYQRWSAEAQITTAVTAERLRIARELHDIVAHSLSLITVQAGIANLVARERPEATVEALRVIEAASRESLTDMRKLLGALRSESAEPAGELSPTPGLESLTGLVEPAARAGVEVTVDVTGAQSLPDGIALAVYRIVQEAVTNVVKHAAPARCRVSVSADAERVRVEVVDRRHGPARQRAPAAIAGGLGLIGMRERVAVYGGELRAEPRPPDGFAVTAVLPLEDAGRLEAAQLWARTDQ